jgi:hypothetical protein
MNALIKIKIVVPNDVKEGDEIRFVYDYEKSSLIFPVDDWVMAFETDKKKVSEYNQRMKYYRENFISDKKLSKMFEGREISGKFKSFSRIDYTPIVEIDVSLEQLREDKINEILK